MTNLASDFSHMIRQKISETTPTSLCSKAIISACIELRASHVLSRWKIKGSKLQP